MKVGFVGMTHLGLISASAARQNGFDVVGVDTHLIEVRLDEPGFSEFEYGFDFNVLRDCDLVFITHDVDQLADVGRVDKLFRLAEFHSDCPIVVMSQVPIGKTRELSQMNEAATFYQLDTLRMGDAMERALYPEMITVGCNRVSSVSGPYLDYLAAFRAQIRFVLYEEAEIAKSMINVYLAAQVAVTNVGEHVCKLHDVDWSAIIPTLQADARIGPKAYLKPGNGFDGSHLVRDIARIGGEIRLPAVRAGDFVTALDGMKYGVG